MSEELPSPEDFSGVVRLFPLPNLVLFPSVVQPLHIFEPRYRRMMADALADDRLLALVLLQPGWEEEYNNRPPIHRVACLGRIFEEERLANGRYNLLLHGLTRIRIEEELPADRPYRQARVQFLADVPCPQREPRLRAEMERVLPALLGADGAGQARKLFDGELTLGALADVFTFALPLESAVKQQLLEELNVARRTEQLLTHVAGLSVPEAEPVPAKFPPDFSEN